MPCSDGCACVFVCVYQRVATTHALVIVRCIVCMAYLCACFCFALCRVLLTRDRVLMRAICVCVCVCLCACVLCRRNQQEKVNVDVVTAAWPTSMSHATVAGVCLAACASADALCFAFVIFEHPAVHSEGDRVRHKLATPSLKTI